MTLLRLKITFVFSTVLISVSMFLAFLSAPYLGSIYQGIIQNFGDSLPSLTRNFSMPMLRVTSSLPYQHPVNLWWVSTIWGILIITPIPLMIWSIQATSVEKCLARWTSGLMLYFPILMILFITIFSGLFIAIAPFPNITLQ